jgi:hypothetical protein
MIINKELNVFTVLDLHQMEYDNYIIYGYSCERVILWGGGGPYTKAADMIANFLTDRTKAVGMIAYLLIDRALGTGGSHFVSIDTSPYPYPELSRTYHPIHFSKKYLILSFHLRLGLPSGKFPSSFPTKTLDASSPVSALYPAHLILI